LCDDFDLHAGNETARWRLYVSFKHISDNLTNFMGSPNSVRILYNTCFLSES
jgi:hypothetical protein